MAELVGLPKIAAVPAAVALFSHSEGRTFAQRAAVAYRNSLERGPWQGRVVLAVVAYLVPIVGYIAFGLSGLVIGLFIWIGLVYLIVRLELGRGLTAEEEAGVVRRYIGR